MHVAKQAWSCGLGRSSVCAVSHFPGKIRLHGAFPSYHAHGCRFVLSTDKRLLRLKPFARSAAVWFRNPYAHVLLVRRGPSVRASTAIHVIRSMRSLHSSLQVSTAELQEYKALKVLLKRSISEFERDWGSGGGAEWMICFVRPFALDAQVWIRGSIKKLISS